MFLVFCEEDSSYLIVEETKAIFEDGVKKDDTIQFFHCNKMYTGCVIERSDNENVLKMSRKQAMEKDKKTVKTSKSIRHLPKNTKRQKVSNVPYSPPLQVTKKVTYKKRKINNKIKKDKATNAYNVKTQDLGAVLSSSSEENSEFLSSDEEKSNKCDNNHEDNTEVISHDLVRDKSQCQSAAESTTIVTLLRRIKEIEAENAHLTTLVKNRALSPSSSSGIESVTEKENIHAFKNRASTSTDTTKHLTDTSDKESRTISQRTFRNKDIDTHSNIIVQHNSIERQFEDYENEVPSGQKPNDNIEDFLLDVPRKLYQLYGKDFTEDGETMVLLRNDIFCKSSVLHYALGSSSRITHLVRKLVLGVFKKEIFKKGNNQVTLTGCAPRFVGKELQATYDNIDVLARSAIIKYAKAIGKLKKWPNVRTKDLERTLSQRIGELKREAHFPFPH